MRSVLVSILAVAACHGASSTPRTPAPARPVAVANPYAAKIDALVDAVLADHRAVGLAVAVARGDQLLVAKGYGVADVAHATPVTADTVFRIGSVTKQFTAVAILQLVERGELKLTDDVRTYVPEFPAKSRTVTIEHLLTHTSGIPSYTDAANWIELGAKRMTHAQMLALFADAPLGFDPGTRWEYSNSNYYLLGMVIEKVTGKPYAEVIRDRVLAPAGMTASGYCTDTMPGLAAGYSLHDGTPAPAAPVDMSTPYAAGALCSTVGDLLAWQRALDTGVVLAPETIARMRTAATLANGDSTHYGYAVFLGDLDGHPRIGHGGGINGFTSMLARYPDDDVTIAVLANAEVDTPDRLEQRIARVVLGLPEPTIQHAALAAADRDRFAGTYTIQGFGSDEMAVEVRAAGDGLELQVPGQPAATLVFQGDAAFVVAEDNEIRVEFHAGAGGPATGMTIHQGGMAIEAKRTPP
jgi:CubicO group peptidase (beta-lactamase class C family)